MSANDDFHTRYRQADNARGTASGLLDQVMKYALQVAYLQGEPGINLLVALTFKWSYDSESTWRKVKAMVQDVRADLPDNSHWLGNLFCDAIECQRKNERLQYDATDVLNRKAEDMTVRARQLLARIPEVSVDPTTAFYHHNGSKLRIGVTLTEKKTYKVVRFPKETAPFEVRMATTDRDTPNCERGWQCTNLIPRPTI